MNDISQVNKGVPKKNVTIYPWKTSFEIQWLNASLNIPCEIL